MLIFFQYFYGPEQEEYSMKKLIGLMLVFCLVFAVATSALAARPTITKQPETATTNKKGTVTFSIGVKGSDYTITWYFVNPETGEKTSGKKLSSVFKGIKVQNPNSKKVTLKKVPEAMHGWLVYAHISGNGYKVDSDQVQLLVYGLEPPASAPASSAETPEETPAEAPAEAPAETPAEAPAEAPADENGSPAPADNPEAQQPAADDEGVNPDAVAETITVTANAALMYKLDASGKQVEDTASNRLEFEGAGSVLVRSDDPIESWSINGIRVQPAEPVKEFKLLNISSNLSLDVKINRASASEAVLDESHMCKVVCQGCTFTYRRGQLISVTEGEVPSGAPISVFADTAELAAKGYSINGGEATNQGLASFRLTVTDDVTISIK